MIQLKLFAAFAKVGALGFGGGPSMIPLMQAECVSNEWMTDEAFLQGLAMGSSLPGPIATKMAVYVGYEAGGVLGALFAVAGVVTPSAVVMLVASSVLMQYREHPAVKGALQWAKPAVVAMLAFVVVEFWPKAIVGRTSFVIGLVSFVLLVGKVHPAWVMLGAALGGALLHQS